MSVAYVDKERLLSFFDGCCARRVKDVNVTLGTRISGRRGKELERNHDGNYVRVTWHKYR